MTETSIASFVVPLQKSSVLIPQNTVAEIISYEPLQRVLDSPDWFLGFLSWRGIQVPVASIEMLTVAGASFSLVSVSSASLVILRVMASDYKFKYMALVAQTIPKLKLIEQRELTTVLDTRGFTELARSKLAEENVVIPDLDYIEAQIQAVAFGDEKA